MGSYIDLTYIDGYRSGQHDALTWIAADTSDDATLAAFDEAVQMRAALICLAANLVTAAGLCWSFELGKEHMAAAVVICELRRGREQIRGWQELQPWHPGCQRPANERG